MSGFILGIAGHLHDGAACLLHDANIVAAVCEERFSRINRIWRIINNVMHILSLRVYHSESTG